MRLAQEVEADGKPSGGTAVSPTRSILDDIASTFQLDLLNAREIQMPVTLEFGFR